tara:strand:- start:235 stop:378 length:144 start_codon:yes stop_codon:yes gene_type:complete
MTEELSYYSSLFKDLKGLFSIAKASILADLEKGKEREVILNNRDREI